MSTLGIENIILLLVGFYLLIKGAEYLIDGSSSLARKLGVSELVIALTVVAFGTSAPELGVNLLSIVNNHGGLAIGNIVGSNMVNLTLIMGLSGLSGSLIVKSRTVWKEIPMALIATLLMIVISHDLYWGQGEINQLTMADGLVLLLFFGFFIGYVISSALQDLKTIKKEAKLKTIPLWRAIILILLGIAGLVVGSKWVVDTSYLIASALNLSNTIVGMTIVALGTSLPELSTSIVAAIKKHNDLAVGNLIGSNIFNICWVLAITVIIRPISIADSVITDMYWMVGAVMLLFIFLLSFRGRHQLSKLESILLMLYYCAFVYFVFVTK